MVFAGRHLATPKSRVVGIGAKRRKNVTAATTAHYVDTQLREDDVMLEASTHQTLQRRGPHAGAIARFPRANR
jgi:hypothetical protein